MRFFSNDARESTDEQSADDQAKDQAHDEQPERVQSDPVAVPHQRPPSPWSDTPTATDDSARTDDPARTDDSARTDAERHDETDDPDAEARRDDTEPPPVPEPGTQPTAFGAATVGGTSATADPDRAAAEDGVVTSSTNTYAGSTADSAPDTVPATWTEGDTRDPDPVVDLPLDDKTETDTTPAADRDVSESDQDVSPGDRDVNQDDSVTTFADSPVVAAPAGSTVDDADRAETATDTDAGPLKDDGSFDDPKAVDPVTETPLDEDSATQSTPAVVAAAPAATKPDTLFDQDDAKSFQERWRDVQLRFVDSPKDAAGDAAKLVDEAVDKLTASLRAQREGLNNDTEDTEQLRVQLRGYRDVLNRILSL
ncbi:hypothetical protein [Actinoplanes sp. NPDC049599]|uniref:hypothetical protein n=1 Tax=Actinoplanes sp. NPDC049599 TaxID=3363903 RepID=UPI0037B193E3